MNAIAWLFGSDHASWYLATNANAVEIVNASNIGAVPVVDGEGRLRGIVTEGDLLRRVASSWARRAGTLGSP